MGPRIKDRFSTLVERKSPRARPAGAMRATMAAMAA